MTVPVIGIDLGGTKIAGALVSPQGQPGQRFRVDTPSANGGRAVAQAVIDLVGQIRATSGHASAIGIGSAGVVDVEGRSIVSATDAIPGWAGTPLADLVEAATGLPVRVINDVHAHALGEFWMGAGRGAESVLMVACGTGVGGALVSRLVEGGVWRGVHGLGGHFGHIPVNATTRRRCSCGRPEAHLESFASGPGLYEWYLERGGSPQVGGARELESRALAYFYSEGDDALAAAVYRDSGRVLGQVLSGLVNSLDPEIVIVGGGLANAGSLWWDPLREGYALGLMDLVREVPLLKPQLESNSAIIGAARMALLSLT